MKQFALSLTFLVLGVIGGYLYGHQYGNIQCYQLGFDLGYHTGFSDAQLPKPDNDDAILIQQLQQGVGDLQIRVGKLEDQ